MPIPGEPNDDAVAAVSEIAYLASLAAICAGMLLALSLVLVTTSVPFVFPIVL